MKDNEVQKPIDKDDLAAKIAELEKLVRGKKNEAENK